MTQRKKILAVVFAGGALAVSAAPAAAAPVSVSTDQGTTCTLDTGKSVGAGTLGIAPIDFTGTVDCTPKQAGNAVRAYSTLRLTSDLAGLKDVLPLGLGAIGGASGSQNDPSNVDELGQVEGNPPGCDIDGGDCNFSGRANGLPATTYQVAFNSLLRAPAGETWTNVPEGCQRTETSNGFDYVACTSTTEPFTTAG